MEDPVISQVLAGLLATVLTSCFNRSYWTKRRKQYMSLAVSVVVGTLVLIYREAVGSVPADPVEFVNWVVVTVGSVAAISQIIYAQLSTKFKELEYATTPEPKHMEPPV